MAKKQPYIGIPSPLARDVKINRKVVPMEKQLPLSFFRKHWKFGEKLKYVQYFLNQSTSVPIINPCTFDTGKFLNSTTEKWSSSRNGTFLPLSNMIWNISKYKCGPMKNSVHYFWEFCCCSFSRDYKLNCFYPENIIGMAQCNEGDTYSPPPAPHTFIPIQTDGEILWHFLRSKPHWMQ